MEVKSPCVLAEDFARFNDSIYDEPSSPAPKPHGQILAPVGGDFSSGGQKGRHDGGSGGFDDLWAPEEGSKGKEGREMW